MQEQAWVWWKQLWIISCVVLIVPCQGYLVVLDVSIEGPWMASDIVASQSVCSVAKHLLKKEVAIWLPENPRRPWVKAQGSDALRENVTSSPKRKKQHARNFFSRGTGQLLGTEREWDMSQERCFLSWGTETDWEDCGPWSYWWLIFLCLFSPLETWTPSDFHWLRKGGQTKDRCWERACILNHVEQKGPKKSLSTWVALDLGTMPVTNWIYMSVFSVTAL